MQYSDKKFPGLKDSLEKQPELERSNSLRKSVGGMTFDEGQKMLQPEQKHGGKTITLPQGYQRPSKELIRKLGESPSPPKVEDVPELPFAVQMQVNTFWKAMRQWRELLSTKNYDDLAQLAQAPQLPYDKANLIGDPMFKQLAVGVLDAAKSALVAMADKNKVKPNREDRRKINRMKRAQGALGRYSETVSKGLALSSSYEDAKEDIRPGKVLQKGAQLIGNGLSRRMQRVGHLFRFGFGGLEDGVDQSVREANTAQSSYTKTMKDECKVELEQIEQAWKAMSNYAQTFPELTHPEGDELPMTLTTVAQLLRDKKYDA